MTVPEVAMGANLSCTFGAAPSSLVVLPGTVQVEGVPAATVMHNVPMTNVMPFGMCSSLANPTVAAATAAASGVLTPMPCVPVTPAPWVTGAPTVLVNGFPCLNMTSTLTCAWAGVISVVRAGTTRTLVP